MSYPPHEMPNPPDAFVYVIESPGDSDLLDGRTEGRALCELLRLAEIPFAYSLVTTRKSFETALGDRLQQSMNQHHGPGRRPKRPILHFSMHGFESYEGMQLTSGEYVTWPDVHELVRPLCILLEGKLDVCFSSCYGTGAVELAFQELTAPPVRHIVSHNKSVLWSDAAVAFITFYHLLFNKLRPISECVDVMKAASGDHEFQYLHGWAVRQIMSTSPITHEREAARNKP